MTAEHPRADVSDDIVERLRALEVVRPVFKDIADICGQAADEIERLRRSSPPEEVREAAQWIAGAIQEARSTGTHHPIEYISHAPEKLARFILSLPQATSDERRKALEEAAEVVERWAESIKGLAPTTQIASFPQIAAAIRALIPEKAP